MADETSETESELLDTVRRFLDRNATDALQADRFDTPDPDALFQELAELGVFAICSPDSADGLGLSPSALVPLFRLFGERLVTGPLLEQALLPGILLDSMGKAPANPRAADLLGEATMGVKRVALVDGGASIDWADLLQGLRRSSGGSIDGTVGMSRFAEGADLLVLLVEGDAPAVAILEASDSSTQVEPLTTAPSGTLFSAVTIRPEAPVLLVAEHDAARDLIRTIRSWVRLLLAAELAGLARKAIDTSVDYVKVREQFGKPVGAFQAVKHIAATAAARTIVAENLCRAVADDARWQGSADFVLGSMAAKAHCSEIARSVCEDAIQLHGGIGFTKDLPLHRYYIRSLALRSWYGDEVELSGMIGHELLSAEGNAR